MSNSLVQLDHYMGSRNLKIGAGFVGAGDLHCHSLALRWTLPQV